MRLCKYIADRNTLDCGRIPPGNYTCQFHRHHSAVLHCQTSKFHLGIGNALLHTTEPICCLNFDVMINRLGEAQI
jgi:hypothetical protein